MVESNIKDGNTTDEGNGEGNWWIPVSYTSGAEKEFQDAQPKLWFNEEITIPDPAKPEDWLLVNLQVAGNEFLIYFTNIFHCTN